MAGMTDLHTLAAALRARKISVHGLIEESLRKIARWNPRLNAFITVTADAAGARARQLDDELARGIDRGALHGIPIAHKDLVRTKGVLTTGGSKILAGYVPKRDAAIAARLDQAGAVLVGKTGLHELAYGVTSNNPHFGPVHNPWDLERISGGSSGGSAAAVAAGIVPLATGTDTGGSIRIPASFCGVVGLKPTFGRVNSRGVLPLSASMDHVGPITRTVRDAAIAFQAMVDAPTGYVPPADADIRGIRIGLPRNFYFERIDVEVSLAVRTAVQTAAAIGARIVEIDVPDMAALNAAARTIQLPEALAAWKAYLGRRGDFGADVLALLDQGREVAAVDYLEGENRGHATHARHERPGTAGPFDAMRLHQERPADRATDHCGGARRGYAPAGCGGYRGRPRYLQAAASGGGPSDVIFVAESSFLLVSLTKFYGRSPYRL